MDEEQCILHWKPVHYTEPVIQCSTSAYEKIKDFCCSWKWTLSTQDVEVARRFMATVPQHAVKEVPQVCFHRSCYARFTNKDRLQKAKVQARLAAKPKTEPETEPAVAFPNTCIFCRKEFSSCRRKKEPGYKAERLTRCRRPNVVAKIRAKAAELKDHDLLRQIRGRDLIAEWAKYHETCYAVYVNKYRASTVPESEWPAMDEEAFRHFMVEELKPLVYDGKSCVSMISFSELFNKSIKRSMHLKSELPLFRLRNHCPFLRFTKDEDSEPLSTAPQESASDQLQPDDHHGEQSDKGPQKVKGHINGSPEPADIFRFAQQVHGKITQVLMENQEAPPPLELLNFLAACVAGSQVSPDAFTRLPNATRGKVTRIARNIVHLAADVVGRNGRTRAGAAPAQMALPGNAGQSRGIEALAEEWLSMYGLLSSD